ncbi:MAG: thiamine pyrophosphate-dependent enzyme [Paludibacter sp.]|nr:thiamine pyrophosphate-dependent enzyme [Paludibacter sp.]MDD4199068.1 thiamine pyrophosphate-dependent enzyme [Paludibacter sp.]
MNKERELLLGAEVIAVAAIDEGISGVYAYPGTPSTEITTYIQESEIAGKKKIRSNWSANEKTAYEAALGMSYAGKRSLVCMKHVGLNVAADAFINSAVTGINGGLVLLVADDPSMHSSQNEQDTRFYGKYAYLPLLEPSNQQEAYHCVRYAFNLSEEVKLPVIIRITTRLSHSRSVIERTAPVDANQLAPETDRFKWILLPAIARKRYNGLLDMQKKLVMLSETSAFNREIPGKGDFGIIAFGLAFNYTMEVNSTHQLNIPVLKISQYPLPEKTIKDFCNRYTKVLIAEEGYPIYEELLRGFFDNNKFSGRLDGTLPRTGELSPDVVAKALLNETKVSLPIPEIVTNRPPELCQGCSHRDLYEALNKALEGYANKHVFADIGCYTLGALPPYNAINTCVDMGASVTMAKGASDAGLHPAVAVIGDSTFTHSGITGLLDAVNDKTPMTLIISDNYTTAMTGGQDSAGTNKLQQICEGIGVKREHIHTIVPLKKNLEENIATLKSAFDYEGVSVILACRECIQTLRRKNLKK